MGSRRTTERRNERLRAEGVTDEQLSRHPRADRASDRLANARGGSSGYRGRDHLGLQREGAPRVRQGGRLVKFENSFEVAGLEAEGVGPAHGRPTDRALHARRGAQGNGRREPLEGRHGGQARADLAVVRHRRDTRCGRRGRRLRHPERQGAREARARWGSGGDPVEPHARSTPPTPVSTSSPT